MKNKSWIAGAVLLPAAGGFALGFQFGPRILGALCLLAAWTATAQPDGPPSDQGNGPNPQQSDSRPPPGPGRHRHPMPLIIKALDKNGDGIIDASEIAKASAALLKLDKNGDGKLTVDEYLGPWANGTNGPPPGPDGRRLPILPLVKALDANGDGIIDASEIANASVALLKLDKNADGKLTPDEYQPPRPPPPDGPDSSASGQARWQGPPPGYGPPDGPPPGDGPPDGPPPGDGPPDGPPPGGPPPDGNGPPNQ
jgi:hypothetical protein